jgi:hypothetical protein
MKFIPHLLKLKMLNQIHTSTSLKLELLLSLQKTLFKQIVEAKSKLNKNSQSSLLHQRIRHKHFQATLDT